MPIRFHCPQGHWLAAPKLLAGSRTTCPNCGQEVMIPLRDVDEPTPGPELRGGGPLAKPAGRPPQHKPLGKVPLGQGGSSGLRSNREEASRTDRALSSAEIAKRQALTVAETLPASQDTPLDNPPIQAMASPPPIPPRHPSRPEDRATRPEQRVAQPKPPATERSTTPAAPTGSGIGSHGPAELPGYYADQRRRRAVYLLGVALGLLAVFQLAPLRDHLDLIAAPAWARAVLLISILELAYVVWMVTVPDWSTVWVATYVFGAAATLYGAALAVTVVAPRNAPMPLELDENRDLARLWCVVVVLLTLLMTYATGTIAARWRKALRKHP